MFHIQHGSQSPNNEQHKTYENFILAYNGGNSVFVYIYSTFSYILVLKIYYTSTRFGSSLCGVLCDGVAVGDLFCYETKCGNEPTRKKKTQFINESINTFTPSNRSRNTLRLIQWPTKKKRRSVWVKPFMSFAFVSKTFGRRPFHSGNIIVMANFGFQWVRCGCARAVSNWRNQSGRADQISPCRRFRHSS